MAKMKDLKESGSLHDGTKRQNDLWKKYRAKFKKLHPGKNAMRPITIFEQVV